jgi:hypothetical protein
LVVVLGEEIQKKKRKNGRESGKKEGNKKENKGNNDVQYGQIRGRNVDGENIKR